MQIAISTLDEARGPYSRFRLIEIAGYRGIETSDIYLAAVHPNPLDALTLIGLFPVSLGGVEIPASAGHGHAAQQPFSGFIGLSISCNGLAWSPLVVLDVSNVTEHRTWDQPVHGLLIEGDAIHALVHKNVPGIASPLDGAGVVGEGAHRRGGGSERRYRRAQHRPSYLQPYVLNRDVLRKLTRAARRHLPGCAHG